MAATKPSNPMELLALWAKTSRDYPDMHHPLLFHMLDVGLVARCWQPAQMGQFGTREIRGVEELG